MTNKQVYIHRQIGTLGLAATHFLKELYNTRTIVIGTIVGRVSYRIFDWEGRNM